MPEAVLSSPWQLFRQSLGIYRANWKSLVGLLMVVFVPVTLISTYVSDISSDTTLSAYMTFAEMIGNAALIFAVIQLFKGRRVSWKQAYYLGTAPLVRLMLVLFLLVLMLLPLALGFVVLGTGVVTPDTSFGLPERILLILLAISLAIPSFIMLARAFGAIFIVFEDSTGPVTAIQQSRALTKGSVRKTLARMVILTLLLVLLMALPVIILKVLQIVSGWSFFDLAIQLLLVAVASPITAIYMYRYYREIKA